MKRSQLATIATLALVLGLSGCTTDSKPSADQPPVHTDPIKPPSNDAGRAKGEETPLCSDPIVGNGARIDPFCNLGPEKPGSDAFKQKIAYKAGRAPHSTKIGDEINVSSFALNAMRLQRTVWKDYFSGTDVDVPTFGADVVVGAEKYKSNCPNSDVFGELPKNTYVAKTTSPAVLYCPLDNRTTGHVAIPGETLAKLWKDTDRKTADMAAAIVLARAGSQMLNQALLASPGRHGSLNRLPTSSCLAGVWAHGAYKSTEADDLDRALVHAKSIKVNINGETLSSADSDMAWQIGFTEGNVAVCLRPETWLEGPQQ